MENQSFKTEKTGSKINGEKTGMSKRKNMGKNGQVHCFPIFFLFHFPFLFHFFHLLFCFCIFWDFADLLFVFSIFFCICLGFFQVC
jgi:hypothetical protein